MDTSPKYNIPWELIAESLTGSLTVEEELQLTQWLLSDPDNNAKYLKIQELLENGMEDYQLYKMADGNEAWKSLHLKLQQGKPESKDTKVIQGSYSVRPAFSRNMVAVAAVFLGLVGIGLWYILTKDSPVIYETAFNEQKKVTLVDGSAITLEPLTKIEISKNYNKTSRTVIMTCGEAYFDVVHRTDKPFTVELGATQIKDIGTTFTIRKGEKKINITVTSGKVAFVKVSSKEGRELSAGSGVTFDVEHESFDEIKPVKSSMMDRQMMNFNDTPLADVVMVIQKVYGKKVVIGDHKTANKKITAQLDGVPYDTVMKVICKSLKLEYFINDSVYVLKEITRE